MDAFVRGVHRHALQVFPHQASDLGTGQVIDTNIHGSG
jgi:hypothetical protein